MKRSVALGVALIVAASPTSGPKAQADQPSASSDSLAGLRWRFVRIQYNYDPIASASVRELFGEPWAIDGPAAEQNLTRRIQTATSIQVDDPIVMPLDDPELFLNPWIYFVEPGNLTLLEHEIPILREFLLRGGTAMFDDFHGPVEWDHFVGQMKLVFPDREVVDVPDGHPVYSAFYELDGYRQVAGLGSFMAGRSWEKGGYVARLRTIFDDDGRPMLFVNWNTDMGDGLEWSNAEEFPGYLPYTSLAYRMAINQIVYALTH